MARPKGTPNKTTAELRQLLTCALEGEIASIPERLATIDDPERRLATLARFLPFILPKPEAGFEERLATLAPFIPFILPTPEPRIEP